jgi:glycosyltransferase involved in cell wall biosynthesis
MSSPKVSVIVPAYNSGDLVRRAIESACAQTYEDYEVIVVDDGSTDDTWDAIQRAAEARPKVRAIRAAHAGLAAARNRAIAEMRGEWIALLDADDVWLPEKLQRCMDYLGEHPEFSIVYTPMDPVLADGRRMKGHSKACHSGPLTEKLFHSIFIHDPAAVFHKRVIEECGPFDESLPVCVGHEFWLRVSTKFEFGLIDEPLALRRWSSDSLTRSDRARARRIKSAMLERFYFERGGREMLTDGKRALRRLARVHYSAGKILLSQRRLDEADEFLTKAIRFAPGYLKTYAFWFACKVARLLRLSRP